MENDNARVFISQQPDDAAWQQIQSTARSAVSDVEAPGIGQRRLQLIVCPSADFEEGQAWEIRQNHQAWWLFRSEVIESLPNVQLIDYRPVLIDPAVLSSFFSRVIALSLPIAPDLDDTAGLDGEIQQLAVFGDMLSECRFQWWSVPPLQWKPLVDLAGEMLNVFAPAARRTG